MKSCTQSGEDKILTLSALLIQPTINIKKMVHKLWDVGLELLLWYSLWPFW